MKLQSGGEPKRVRYISAPSRNINRGIGDPDRVTSVGNEIAKAREWEANWYKGRKATGKFEDQLDDTTYNFMIDRITNSPITVRDGASYRADGANGVTTIKDGEAIITANADPTYERKAESFGNTLGSILTHELDHAATIKDMNVWGQTQEEFDKNSIKSATPSLIKVNDIIKGGIFKGGSNDYINNATGGFGQWLEGKVGIPAEIGEYLNPGAVYGGGKGLNITKNKLATKFIKGDADLGWSALNKDHWIFNKEARTPTNMAMASINRVMPFLSNVEKTPARVAAYKVGTPFILQQENPIYIGSRRVWDSIKSIPRNPYIRRQPLIQGALLTMKKGGSLISDGRRFKFKDSPLVRNSRTLNNKRDMRKKFMKSDRPTYSTNRVRKGQDGLQFVSYTPVETPDIPKFESSDVFSTYNIPIVRDESVVSQPKVDEPRIDEPIIESAVNTPMKRELFNIKPSKGLDEFNKWYDEVEKEDPEAKHYRQFLTKMAEQESGFNSAIQNRAGAPAYGYFQFMQDGKKYNNITAYAGTDIETFRNNPKLQIKAAIKLAKSFERGFNKKDLELAAQKGYTKFGLLGGAWLAGNGGVRKYLQGLANPSDRHWSKSGSGTDVASRIQMFNF